MTKRGKLSIDGNKLIGDLNNQEQLRITHAQVNADDCDIDREYLRADAMQKVATPLVNSAKIEADLISKSGGKYQGTGFIHEQKKLD